METNDLKKIWATLAENKLIDANIAKENIRQLIAKKGVGLLGKLAKNIRREIIIDIITTSLVALIIPSVFIYQRNMEVDRRAHIFLFLVLGFFIFKLVRDIRKYEMLKMTKLTESIKSSTLNSYNKFKAQLKQDIIVAVTFLIGANIYAIYIYYKAFGNFREIDFSTINIQSFGFVLLIFLVLFVFTFPWVVKQFYLRKYQILIDDFESTLEELNSETD